MSGFDSAIEQARQLANTPEGKQLAQLLQQSGGNDLQHALDQAAAGDPRQIKTLLTALLKNPQALKLLEKLGGTHG